MDSIKLCGLASFFLIISLPVPWSGEILKKGSPRVIFIALKLKSALKGVKTRSWYMPTKTSKLLCLDFFSEKNIILLFKNKKIIQENKIILTQKKEIKGDLEKKINNYTNSEISKELILKDKLFLKNKGDKIILYELDKWVAQ